MKRVACVVAVTLLASCSATEPTLPSQPTLTPEPSPTSEPAPTPVFSGDYVLAIQASPTCIGASALPVRRFRWVVRTVAAGTATSFILPSADDPLVREELELQLSIEGDRVQGSLSGAVRVDRSIPTGFLAVLYGHQPYRFEKTIAALSGRVRSSGGRAWITRGIMNGTINMRDYELARSSYGVCTASGHSWSLLRE